MLTVTGLMNDGYVDTRCVVDCKNLVVLSGTQDLDVFVCFLYNFVREDVFII
jgi:hypothetical protein